MIEDEWTLLASNDEGFHHLVDHEVGGADHVLVVGYRLGEGTGVVLETLANRRLDVAGGSRPLREACRDPLFSQDATRVPGVERPLIRVPVPEVPFLRFGPDLRNDLRLEGFSHVTRSARRVAGDLPSA